MSEILSKEKDGQVFKSIDGNGMENGNMDGIQARLCQLITEDTVFVDCGAHIGTMSIPVVVKCKPKKAIFIEANTDVVGLLQENCQANLQTLFTVVHAAVCDKDGEVDFHIIKEKGDSSSMVREDLKKIPPTTVPAITLDTLLENETSPIVMKVDIEGSEWLMWQGMGKVRPKIKHMVMEWFPAAMPGGWKEQLLAAIHKSDFHIMLFSGENITDQKIMELGKDDLWLRSNI